MNPTRNAVPALLALPISLLLVACGSTHGSFVDGGAGDATTDGKGDSGLVLGGDSGSVTGLEIVPGTSTLTVTNPASPGSEALKAMATYPDGSKHPVSASWTLDRFDIASIGAGSGVVTPSGAVFGNLNVTAKAGGHSATAKVNVVLKLVVHDPSIPPASEGLLTGATTPDPAVTSLAYPYDATVFPLGLMPPEIQWNGGAAGDDYLLHYTGPSFDLEIFTTADPPSRSTLTQALWNSLTSTAAASNVSLELHRLSGGMAYVSAKETWKIADANLRGEIYYWAINQGQIIGLDLASGTRAPVFVSGPSTSLGTPAPLNSGSPASPPWEDNGAGSRCVACHSVSKDGSTLVSTFARGGSTGPVGFVSPGKGSINVISDYQTSAIYNALTPDGAYGVANYSDKTMGLLSSSSGMPVASALDGQASLCDPVFSPDGKLFALASSCDPMFGYPVEFRTSNLTLYSFAAKAPFFSSPQTVVTSKGIGDALAFPSFSPDSKWIIFQRGDYSRAKYTDATMTPTHGNDDLYIVAARPGRRRSRSRTSTARRACPRRTSTSTTRRR